MNDYTSLIGSSPLVMTEFYATWCPHCQAMMPVVAQIRDLVGNSADIYQFDIDHSKKVAEELGIEIVPTFIIYRNGVQVWRYSGEIEGNVLLKKLEGFMN